MDVNFVLRLFHLVVVESQVAGATEGYVAPSSLKKEASRIVTLCNNRRSNLE
jgi:hypothetical protein